MRQIKFRGKRLDNDEWVYGFLYQLELLPYCGLGAMILTDDDNCESDAIIPFNLAFRKGVDLFMVDKETVGQFTGLHDADGKEIYEGDLLLSFENSEVFEVVYDAPRFCFKDNDFGFRFLNHPENFLVCGNAYDAPKEGGKEE